MSKNISEDQYDIILNTVILGLYVLAPPRRSKDYLLMKIDTKQDDKQFNYLDLKKKQFVFNNYKTNKTYGEQIVNISDDLILLLKKYLKYKKTDNNFLLNKFNGDEIKSDNAITRKLNKIFGKNIASSMLRHIYLSSKYGSVSKEQSEDAKDMGHSLEMQKEYIKK
jgi:integrase